MLAQAISATLLGVDGHQVNVEVQVGVGLPGFTIVGLPDASCRESRDRVRAAINESKFKWPDKRVTANLAPTNLRKAGSGLDLAMAVAILGASEQLPAESLKGLAFLGELGLDGRVRSVLGALPLIESIGDALPVVPVENLAEARLLRPDARAVRNLAELVAVLKGDEPWPDPPPRFHSRHVERVEPDLSEVQGQAIARRALEVAAAGSHHMVMVGPPGAGKTMLAERLTSLLPDMDDRDAMDVSRIHSAAGTLRLNGGLSRRPPYRSPHHTASLVALIGGGTVTMRPGEISLASGGVLFLDELGEFPAGHLDALRQPLEDGVIRVARAMNSAVLPARFHLIAASNPCPCGIGRWGDCRCSPAQLARYSRRLSAPFLDRFDIRLAVDPPDHSVVFSAQGRGESSASVRERVVQARERARARGVRTNRDLRGDALEKFAPLSRAGRDLLRSRLKTGTLSMRGAQRLRVLALTMRDLDGGEGPLSADDLSEAMILRGDEVGIGVVA
ncbi:MAG: YifB family Mg chelatase-like AAA ATPase [Microthrixaceae bacterium]